MSSAKSVVFVDSGVTVAGSTQARARVREANVEYKSPEHFGPPGHRLIGMAVTG